MRNQISDKIAEAWKMLVFWEGENSLRSDNIQC